MNARRGMFRLWLVFSVLFVIGVGAASYIRIRNEFRIADTDLDALAKKYGGTNLLPVNCAEARGTMDRDYSSSEGLCWYTMENFRRFYPEYRDLSDRVISDRVYAKAGIPLRKAHPWEALLDAALLAVGIPLIILALGFGFAWVISGFRTPQS